MEGCAAQMDTKSLIIEIATSLFQQKGYVGVGLNEILKACNISKGALYHHFPNGKEELLITCLDFLNEVIMTDACNQLYVQIQNIYCKKLEQDGLTKDTAYSVSLMMTASIWHCFDSNSSTSCLRNFHKERI